MHYKFKKSISDEMTLIVQHSQMFEEFGFQRDGLDFVMTHEFTLPECVGLTVKVMYIPHYEYQDTIGTRNKEKIELKAFMVPLSFVYRSLGPYITISQEQIVDFDIPKEVVKNWINEIILDIETRLNDVLHLERIS